MKYKVYWRYSHELPPKAHSCVVTAFSKDDAEGVVMFKGAKNGYRVVIIKCYKLEGESRKRHMQIRR